MSRFLIGRSRFLVGCLSLTVGCDGGVDSAGCRPNAPYGSACAAEFEDTLDPDQWHLLVSSTPPVPGEGVALEELALDFTPRWSHALDNDGSAGAVRRPDGQTWYARTSLPPDFGFSLEAIDSSGALLWSRTGDGLGSVGFLHGLVETPDGDLISADAVFGRVFASDIEGNLLWDLALANEGHMPNGLGISVGDDGVTRLAISQLQRNQNSSGDQVQVYRMGARDEPPTLEWTWPPAGLVEEGVWPHGPRFEADGTVVFCLAGAGRVVGVKDGVEQWRIPEGPPIFGFARDAVFLPDGSLLVAEAASEIVRVADPFGSFTVVDTVSTPGVFNLNPIDCSGDRPCFGLP